MTEFCYSSHENVILATIKYKYSSSAYWAAVRRRRRDVLITLTQWLLAARLMRASA